MAEKERFGLIGQLRAHPGLQVEVEVGLGERRKISHGTDTTEPLLRRHFTSRVGPGRRPVSGREGQSLDARARVRSVTP